jgi:hypothetical protein
VKMKIGFDLDGTLDRPQLATLARYLHEEGHEVHVITCSRIAQFGYSETRDNKVKKLLRLAVPYTKLHLVEGGTYSEAGVAKAGVIEREGIELMFDDSPTFCEIMTGLTKAVILRVKEPMDMPHHEVEERHE